MPQRTYWHLLEQQRAPSDYEVVTSRLLYYPERGFEVGTPIGRWYDQHQGQSAVQSDTWEQFADPNETTYATYVERRQEREAFLDALLEVGEKSNCDRNLPQQWLDTLERVLAPLRFPLHGLQMVSAYIGSMAPSGRITVAALFQAGDEMRWVQRLAYRTRQLQLVRDGFGQASKAVWLDDPGWQPLRRAIERLLVSYDWSEAFLVHSLVMKPIVSEIFLAQLAQLAAAASDDLLHKILLALLEDQEWHDTWARAALAPVLASERNRDKALSLLQAHTWSIEAIVEGAEKLFEEPAKQYQFGLDQLRPAVLRAVDARLCQAGLQS